MEMVKPIREFLLRGQASRCRIMHEAWKEGQIATLKYKEMVSNVVQPGMHILHAGCGWDKNNVASPYKGNCHVAGIDVDPRVASKYHSEFHLGSITDMPFKEESFDLILSEYVLEHVEEPERAFREFARVLRPGGLLLLLTPNLYSYKNLIAYFTPYKFHIWMGEVRYGRGHEADMYPTLYRCNTANRLVRTALANGFQIRTLEFLTNGPTWFEKFPILFEIFHLFHLAIVRWEGARQLRCALILQAIKEAHNARDNFDSN